MCSLVFLAANDTWQGRKKIKQVEAEIQHLTKVRHPNLVSVFAVKLQLPSNGPPQLMVLYEQTPALNLHDVLDDCDFLREERATVSPSPALA